MSLSRRGFLKATLAVTGASAIGLPIAVAAAPASPVPAMLPGILPDTIEVIRGDTPFILARFLLPPEHWFMPRAGVLQYPELEFEAWQACDVSRIHDWRDGRLVQSRDIRPVYLTAGDRFNLTLHYNIFGL